jgi:hypothetical protein
MTVGELMEALDQFDPDSEVRWAAQPSWPFEYSISSVVPITEDELVDEEDAEDRLMGEIPESPKRDDIVYLVEGTQLGYLPGYVCREIGWK